MRHLLVLSTILMTVLSACDFHEPESSYSDRGEMISRTDKEFCSPGDRRDMISNMDEQSGETILDLAYRYKVKDIDGFARCFYSRNAYIWNHYCDNETTTLIAAERYKHKFNACLKSFNLYVE